MWTASPIIFESNIRPVHLYGKTFVRNAALEIAQGRPFSNGQYGDAGRAKWVESLANDLHVSAAFVFKKRLSGEETDITAISANVQDQLVIIYDDMIRTGGSLPRPQRPTATGASRYCRDHLPTASLPATVLKRSGISGLVEKLVCTDTHPNALQISDPFLEVKLRCAADNFDDIYWRFRYEP